MPSESDVWEFVPTKVDKILAENEINLDKDSMGIKGIGKSFIYYKGTFTDKAPIMISSDRNVYDEVDKSKASVIQDYSSRMGYSQLGQKIYLSTPTIPDAGIDSFYQRSDQKHWRFTCPYCGHRQHMEWEENVDFDREIYMCKHCFKPLSSETIMGGEWEARFPERKISGYWMPQMICTWRTAADLIGEFRDAEDEQYFFNFVLGVPYLNPESQIPASLINKNLIGPGNDGMGCSIGVDVQLRELYVILGNNKGIFGITALEDRGNKTKWDRLGELIEVYESRFVVIDAHYDTNSVLEFAKRYPNKVYMNWYQEDSKKLKIVRFGDEGKFTDKTKTFEEEIKVLTDRNRIIDSLIDDLRRGVKIKFNFLKGDDRIKELIKHLKRLYSRTVTDKVGLVKREWASLGQDDFLHALVYWKIANDKRKRFEG